MLKKGQIINPTGKGGFQERPEDINRGGHWRPEDTQSFCLRGFMRMSEEEFNKWLEKNPPNKRTVAQILAYERIQKARKDLVNYKEVTDRAEGKARQYTDINMQGEKINTILYLPNERTEPISNTIPTEITKNVSNK
jgi:hypothetical protein